MRDLSSKTKAQLIAELDAVQAELSALKSSLKNQVEGALAEDGSVLRSLIDHWPDVIYVKDQNSRFVAVNRAAARSLGVERVEDVVGKTDFDFFAPDAAARRRADEQFVIENCTAVSGEEEQITRLDGTVIWLSIIKLPYRSADGRVVGVIGIGRDVSDYRRTLETLRESEERFRAMSDTAPIGIFLTDPSGDCIYANRAYLRISGLTYGRALGRGWLEAIHPEDRERVFAEWYQAVSSHRFPFYIRNRFLKPDGSVVWAEVQAAALQTSETTTGYMGLVEDITTRSEAETALAQERSLLRTLIDNLPLEVYVKDRQSRFVVANIQVPKYIGEGKAVSAAEELIGKMDFDFMAAEYAQSYFDEEQRLMASGETLTNKEVSYTLPGQPGLHWILATKVPLRDQTGTVVGLVGVQQNITERKNAEQALHESQRFIESITNTMPAMVYVFDLVERRAIYSNRWAVTMLGYSHEQIEQMDNWLASIAHPDDRAMAQQHVERLALLMDHEIAQCELRVLNRDGDLRWLLTREIAYTRADHGVVMQVVGIAEDITERKHAQEQLQQRAVELETVAKLGAAATTLLDVDDLLDQVVDVTRMSFGLYHVQVYLFDEAESSLTLAAGSGEIGRQLKNRRHHIAYHHPNSIVALCARERQGIISNDTIRDPRVLPNDLLTKTCAEMALPLVIGDKLIGVFDLQAEKAGHFTDEDLRVQSSLADLIAVALQNARAFTALRRSQEEQARLVVELEHVNRDLNDFAYIVSHDLKAPLRAISSLADWLAADYAEKLDQEGQNMLDLLGKRVARMDALINGVLEYSRIGRVSEAKITIGVGEIIRSVIETLAPPPHIEVRVENTLPTLLIEPTRMQQVFQNLIGNAVKYMDKPQGLITIGCLDESAAWRFSVADNGPGIEPIYHTKVFQIFQTLTARDQFESTGVGLTIVKRIVELYGGQIWVESNVGEGSVFYFTLPK